MDYLGQWDNSTLFSDNVLSVTYDQITLTMVLLDLSTGYELVKRPSILSSRIQTDK